ncbi:hypothetical protein FGO68_gene4249 [Halteria grandinella]|uniref:Uncharacterized protein n=1 Tax=Halteria grandinella TaxID=5974 RepID=A0A8J8T6G8_HALGN|nr:hypothetical protein FGO68_gene4249 [Halteria grandinella]
MTPTMSLFILRALQLSNKLVIPHVLKGLRARGEELREGLIKDVLDQLGFDRNLNWGYIIHKHGYEAHWNVDDQRFAVSWF